MRPTPFRAFLATSAVVQKFASFSLQGSSSELPSLNRTEFISLLVSFRIRSSLRKARRRETNFGFQTPAAFVRAGSFS
jgi:hypothetical protein